MASAVSLNLGKSPARDVDGSSLGLKEKTAKQTAYSSKGPWRMARTYGMHKALANWVIEAMGYTSMESMVRARSQ